MNKAQIADFIYKINKKLYYQLRYLYTRHKLANFNKPSNLSEYLLSEMLKPSFKQFAPYADKVQVREYVKSKGLEHILPECYGVWSNADGINFDELPNKFALKTNHGCGNHIICRDKNKLNITEATSQLNDTLSNVFSIREPHYQYIPPKVFAEEFIDDGTGRAPIDYKFMCINGEPLCILICTDREDGGKLPKLSTYSILWEPLDWIKENRANKVHTKPENLEEMVKVAKVLSKDFAFVRVDLYNCNSRGVIFGELTFTPASGLMGYFTTEALMKMNPNTK